MRPAPRFGLAALLATSGCASPPVLLKDPAADRCIDGVASRGGPERVEAAKPHPAGASPSEGSLASGDIAPATAAWRPPTEPPRTSVLVVPTVDYKRIDTRTIVPATDTKSVACDGPSTPLRGGACARVSILVGPFVLTDLYAPGTCADEIFAYADHETSRGWFIFNPATQSLNMHGVELVVGPEEKLYVGVRTDKGPLRSDPLRCSITLSGWTPEVATQIE
jgi:hypothetical protein